MKRFLFFITLFCLSQKSFSQTEIDGLMMQKNYFCVGALGGYSRFHQYWEGTLKRENSNFGSIESMNATVMGNFGVSDKINFIFSLPYISTRPTAGNMDKEYGLQDLSLWTKIVVLDKKVVNGDLKLIVIGGYTFPTTNYAADFQPLSIGLHSHQGTGRVMFDYHRKKLSLTASASFIGRSNVVIDRNTYYTTEMLYSNIVAMPNAGSLNLRVGHRDERWILEGIFDYSQTFGGFDIPRNGMPFLSNRTSASKVGIHFKYETPINGLSLLLDGMTTIDGRNVGKVNSANFAIFYILDFSKKESKTIESK
jgi:hypothetical protein